MNGVRQTLALLATSALTGAALVAATGAPAAQAAAAEPVRTNFGLQAKGWSTQVRGGDVAARSGPTGLAYVLCTRDAGRDASNNTAAINLPADQPLVDVGATETRAWTRKSGGTVSSHALNKVTRVTVGDTAGDALVVEGIRTSSLAFHDGTGFHQSGSSTVASVTLFTNGVGVELPNPGRSVDVPGLAEVSFGQQSGTATDKFAAVTASGLRIDLDASSSTIFIGHAYSRIDGGAVAGVMHAPVWGSKLTGAGRVANSGRTALRPLPCLGTNGDWRSNRVATVLIPSLTSLGEVVSRVRGDQSGNTAYAQGISTITRASLLGRGIVLKGIRAEALVRLRSDGTRDRSAAGTSLASITVGGEKQPVPGLGETLTVPGVARISVGRITHTADGIKVTAVYVTLLDGSQVQSRLSLGNVNLGVRRS